MYIVTLEWLQINSVKKTVRYKIIETWFSPTDKLPLFSPLKKEKKSNENVKFSLKQILEYCVLRYVAIAGSKRIFFFWLVNWWIYIIWVGLQMLLPVYTSYSKWLIIKKVGFCEKDIESLLLPNFKKWGHTESWNDNSFFRND